MVRNSDVKSGMRRIDGFGYTGPVRWHRGRTMSCYARRTPEVCVWWVTQAPAPDTPVTRPRFSTRDSRIQVLILELRKGNGARARRGLSIAGLAP